MRDFFEVLNPATGEVVGKAKNSAPDEIRDAIERSYRAQSSWAERSADERSKILTQWHRLVEARSEELAHILTSEQGKPLPEARAEITYANSFIHWFSAEANRTYGLTIPSPLAGSRISVEKEPVGVVVAITPWNFPAAMVTRKVAPALAAGCSIVLKPSELTPLTAIALSELAYEAGIPKDVLVVVPTLDAIAAGDILTSSMLISKISFTGSTRVGSILMAQSAPTVKRLSLELGGNAPFVVFDDANLDRSIKAAIAAKFRNAGQTCVSANRFIVQKGIAERFAAQLAEEAGKLTIGSGGQAQIGPLINLEAADRVRTIISDAIEKGAEFVGKATKTPGKQFVAPTVLTNVTPQMAAFRQEIFGPVAPVTLFDSEEEAVELANATPFGLAGYLCTEDHALSSRVSQRIQCGMIGINTGQISSAAIPFGGCKQSGLGREGSSYGIDEYLEIKTLIEAI